MLSDVLKAMNQLNNLRHKWVFMLILPFFGVIFLVIFSDIEKIIKLAKGVGFGIIFVVIVISLIRPIIGGLRSSFTYRPIGNLTVVDGAKGYILSAYGSIFLPSTIGGDIFRIEHMKKCAGSTRKDAFFVASLERVVGLLCLFMLALGISFLDLPFRISTSWFLNVLLGIIIGMCVIMMLIKKAGESSVFFQAVEYVKKYATPFFIFCVFILSFIFQCISLSVPVIVAYSLGGFDVATDIALMTPIIAIFSTLPISIGGVGVRESGYVGMGSLVGIDNEISFLCGLSLSVSIIISGLMGVLFQNELIEIRGRNLVTHESE